MYDGDQSATVRRELLKGNTPTMVLAVLSRGPMHGYGIAREIERRSHGAVVLREGTLYPTLYGLEQQGMVTADWQPAPSGPKRRVYRITEEGLAELDARTRSWSVFVRAISNVIGGAPDVHIPGITPAGHVARDPGR